jgi:hypothetical protein
LVKRAEPKQDNKVILPPIRKRREEKGIGCKKTTKTKSKTFAYLFDHKGKIQDLDFQMFSIQYYRIL